MPVKKPSSCVLFAILSPILRDSIHHWLIFDRKNYVKHTMKKTLRLLVRVHPKRQHFDLSSCEKFVRRFRRKLFSDIRHIFGSMQTSEIVANGTKSNLKRLKSVNFIQKEQWFFVWFVGRWNNRFTYRPK